MALPEDVNPKAVTPWLRDGVRRVTVERRASAQPRRIEIQ